MARALAKCTAVLIGILLAFCATAAPAESIEVLWLGHSTFRITTVTGKVIVIDPFYQKNPRTPTKYKDTAAFGKVDLILVTHGHLDHIADLEDLARTTGAMVVSNYELGNNLVTLGMINGSKSIAMNKGGTVTPLGPDIKVHMVPAEHSSSIDLSAMRGDKPESATPRIEGGAAVGYVIELENGFRIYHSGDTDLFGDMALIGRYYKPDLALICIGGHFTMDPERAAVALRDMIRPKQVIAMHYGTFPVINHTPAELRTALGKTTIKVLDAKPGEAMHF